MQSNYYNYSEAASIDLASQSLTFPGTRLKCQPQSCFLDQILTAVLVLLHFLRLFSEKKTREMHLCLASAAAILISSYMILDSAAHAPTPDFLDDVAINCGSRSNSAAFDGREWVGESQGLEPKGKSTSSRIAKGGSFSADPIPYMSSRISTTQFSYTFQVNPGQKFLRLHFYPASYRGFENSHDFFTVDAGTFTLLKNFSASLTADALGVTYFVKEFCLNVEENEKLQITFSTCQSTKSRKTYAFVNGIEIISMPTSLYYSPDGDSGAPVVGQKNRFYYIDNSTALEMVQRLNIGGSSIPPGEDFCLFRSWSKDANYLLTSGLQPANHLGHAIKSISIPEFVVPLKIYQTAWRTRKSGTADTMHSFTWKIPVDIGFAYLVRLHFCDCGLEMTEGGQRVFSVLINNQIAESETKANIIRLSSIIGVPVYRDYMMVAKGNRKGGKFDLFIALQSSDELVVGILRGLEIFKLSNPDNNLANPDHAYLKQVPTSYKAKIQNILLWVGRKNIITTVLTILIMLLNIIVFKLRQIWVQICLEDRHTCSDTATSKQPFHCFSLAEIISATRNFSDELLIGRGGFGNVYKGFNCGGSEVVAVKRLNSSSKQGAPEFWAEIETLSNIQHIHLVSLIGYCNEYHEMILVYEYMPHGSLAENLYRIGKNGKHGTSLTLEQRLRICIGAARGLEYLHNGIKYGVIHRDVKDSNILLDENLVGKVSDFGLSKLGKLSESISSVSTKVKGTWGYLDPDYLITHKLTRKTDVYAFGVVLLVVLCGKPAVNRRIPGETKTLVSSFRECTRKGEIDDIIDPSLRGKISPETLSKFLTCIESCLQNQPKKRPTMAQVVASLECALEGMQIIPSSISDNAIYVHQPLEVESLAPQFSQSMVSPILEESATVNYPAEEFNSIEVFQSRERDHTYLQKPLWHWPWEALRKIGKPRKKKDLVSDKAPDFGILPESASSGLAGITIDKSVEFSYEELANATNNFSLSNEIGLGGFGTIYYAELRGERAAIKKMDMHGTREFLTELKSLTRIYHRNLVRLIGYCIEDSLFIVYEYINNGNLSQHLHLSGRDPLPWSTRVQIALDSARALEYMHEYTVPVCIHRDIKPSNILIDKSFHAKVADFGLAKLNEVGSCSLPTRLVGTFGYMPPEYQEYGDVSPKVDVYAFGVVLYELISAKEAIVKGGSAVESKSIVFLFEEALNQSEGKDDLRTLVDPRLGDDYPLDSVCKMMHLAKICTHENPQKRPTFRSIVVELMTLLSEDWDVSSFYGS